MPPRKRNTPATVTVDPADLTAILTALAATLSPSQLSPNTTRSAVALEDALGEHAPPYGVFGVDWGLRTGDQA